MLLSLSFRVVLFYNETFAVHSKLQFAFFEGESAVNRHFGGNVNQACVAFWRRLVCALCFLQRCFTSTSRVIASRLYKVYYVLIYTAFYAVFYHKIYKVNYLKPTCEGAKMVEKNDVTCENCLLIDCKIRDNCEDKEEA